MSDNNTVSCASVYTSDVQKERCGNDIIFLISHNLSASCSTESSVDSDECYPDPAVQVAALIGNPTQAGQRLQIASHDRTFPHTICALSMSRFMALHSNYIPLDVDDGEHFPLPPPRQRRRFGAIVAIFSLVSVVFNIVLLVKSRKAHSVPSFRPLDDYQHL